MSGRIPYKNVMFSLEVLDLLIKQPMVSCQSRQKDESTCIQV